ncbi:hypothetical protein BDZ45DRAFT_752029 [Acephala macrosclerotiorum]|nr:hypothetical protein BDZ45DRAFT_752029 [Acephala macrosclerotiorum]
MSDKPEKGQTHQVTGTGTDYKFSKMHRHVLLNSKEWYMLANRLATSRNPIRANLLVQLQCRDDFETSHNEPGNTKSILVAAGAGGNIVQAIMDKSTANLGLPHEVVLSLDSTHKDLSKFERPEDPNYLLISKVLEHWTRNMVAESSLPHEGIPEGDFGTPDVASVSSI